MTCTATARAASDPTTASGSRTAEDRLTTRGGVPRRGSGGTAATPIKVELADVRLARSRDCRGAARRPSAARTERRNRRAIDTGDTTTPAARGTDRGTNDRTGGNAGDVGEPAKALAGHQGAPERMAGPGLRRPSGGGSAGSNGPAGDRGAACVASKAFGVANWWTCSPISAATL